MTTCSSGRVRLIGSSTRTLRDFLLAGGSTLRELILGARVGQMSFHRWEELVPVDSYLCSTELFCLQEISWCMREILGVGVDRENMLFGVCTNDRLLNYLAMGSSACRRFRRVEADSLNLR